MQTQLPEVYQMEARHKKFRETASTRQKMTERNFFMTLNLQFTENSSEYCY